MIDQFLDASANLLLDAVNRSISAGYLVLMLIALRYLWKTAPKGLRAGLWGLVAFRLLCPFSLESALSLIPSGEVVSPEIMMDWTPTINTGIGSVNAVVNPVITETFQPDPAASANPLQILIPIWGCLWLLGIALMGLYALISYARLRRRLRSAMPLSGNVFQSTHIGTPFVLGLIHPRIYLPEHMDPQDVAHVLAHERTHIRRKDHIWKPLGFALLSVYWFHPLLWLAYSLFCRDLELACDEAAVASMTPAQRADYSQALLNCSTPRRFLSACPLAFGEIGIKTRVRSILTYKKPTALLLTLSVLVAVILAVCFLTDPRDAKALDTIRNLDSSRIWTIHCTHIVGKGKDVEVVGGGVITEEDAPFVTELLKEIDGVPVRKPWFYQEEEALLYVLFEYEPVTLENTAIHDIWIYNNKYMEINGDWYLADPDTIAGLPIPALEPSQETTIEEPDPAATAPAPEPNHFTAEGARASVEFVTPGPTGAIGYTFFPDEAQELVTLLNALNPAAYINPETVAFNHQGFVTLTTEEGEIQLQYSPEWVWISFQGYAYCVHDPALIGFLQTIHGNGDGSYETPDHKPLSELRSHYNQEEASIDGVVVQANGIILSNQENWDIFVETVSAGQPASVRCGQYYGDTSIFDLTYDGTQFTLDILQNGQITQRTFANMIYSLTDAPEPYDKLEAYMLTNAATAQFTDPDWDWERVNAPQFIPWLRYITDPESIPLPENVQKIAVWLGQEPLAEIQDSKTISQIVALFDQGSALGYTPKTYSPGATLVFTGESGFVISYQLDIYSALAINGTTFYDYGDVSDDSTDYRLKLWNLLGFETPPDEASPLSLSQAYEEAEALLDDLVVSEADSERGFAIYIPEDFPAEKLSLEKWTISKGADTSKPDRETLILPIRPGAWLTFEDLDAYDSFAVFLQFKDGNELLASRMIYAFSNPAAES